MLKTVATGRQVRISFFQALSRALIIHQDTTGKSRYLSENRNVAATGAATWQSSTTEATAAERKP